VLRHGLVLTRLSSTGLTRLVPPPPIPWPQVAVLCLRFPMSQMDVPERQSYTMAVVRP